MRLITADLKDLNDIEKVTEHDTESREQSSRRYMKIPDDRLI